MKRHMKKRKSGSMGECEHRFVETIVRARKFIGSLNRGEPTTSQPVMPSTPMSPTSSVTQDPGSQAETDSPPL